MARDMSLLPCVSYFCIHLFVYIVHIHVPTWENNMISDENRYAATGM